MRNLRLMVQQLRSVIATNRWEESVENFEDEAAAVHQRFGGGEYTGITAPIHSWLEGQVEENSLVDILSHSNLTALCLNLKSVGLDRLNIFNFFRRLILF